MTGRDLYLVYMGRTATGATYWDTILDADTRRRWEWVATHVNTARADAIQAVVAHRDRSAAAPARLP